MRLPILLTALASLVTPALAQDVKFGGFIEKALSTNYPFTQVAKDISTGVTAGATAIEFEKTAMADFPTLFGGELHQQGDAGAALSWVCYTSPEKTIWFYGDSEMGHGLLTAIGIDNTKADPTEGCADLPEQLNALDFSIPMLGATINQVKTHFGALPEPDQGAFAYKSELPLNDGNLNIRFQDVIYQTDGKAVTGLVLDQLTMN